MLARAVVKPAISVWMLRAAGVSPWGERRGLAARAAACSAAAGLYWRHRRPWQAAVGRAATVVHN